MEQHVYQLTCFSEQVLYKSNYTCWSSTKHTSSSHWNVTCSRYDIAEKLFNNRSLTIYSCTFYEGPPWPWSYGSWNYNYLWNRCLSPLILWVRLTPKARCTILCDEVYQWLAADRWFSLGRPVSSTNKTGHHDITEILLKVELNTIKPNQTFYATVVFPSLC